MIVNDYNKWLSAQKEEIRYHSINFNPKLDDNNSLFYFGLYKHYFNLLNLNFDLKGQSVVEVGPAKIATLCFCTNYGKSYIIEPLIFEDTIDFYKSKNISIINEPAETCNIPKANQAWLFNVLQHVIDPLTVINKLKESVDVIYFFEPINFPTDDKHIHILTENLFIDAFGKEVVNKYVGNSLSNFHSANCVYGKYIINKT